MEEICVSKSIGLALQKKVNLPFLLCFTLYLREIFQVQALGGLCLEGRFNGGVFALPVWGAYIWRGLYMEELIFGILRYFRCFFNHNSFVLKQEGHPATLSTATLILTIMIRKMVLRKRFEEHSEDRDH